MIEEDGCQEDFEDNNVDRTARGEAADQPSLQQLHNPNGAKDHLLVPFPERRQKSEADAVKSILYAANRRIPLYKPPYPNTKMGFIRESELMLDAKFLSLDIKDLKPLFTNDMIDEINNYDRDKIIAHAKACKI